MFEVVTLLGAEIEIRVAFAKFADISFARAERFDKNVQAALGILATFPSSGPVFAGRIHRLVLNPGPFALFYVIEGNRVFIHAFLDTRQHPETIRRRLNL